MTDSRFSTRRGFTMVEILVVTVIIAILLSLVSTAVFRAIVSARISAISIEAANLTLAMEDFKNRHHTYPPADLRNPDNSNSPIARFIKTAFPLYDITRLETDLDAEEIAYAKFDPGYSLVFWMVGFHDNERNPFLNHGKRMGLKLGSVADLTKAFYQFDDERLFAGRYFPQLPGQLFQDLNDNGQWDADDLGTSGVDPEPYEQWRAFLYFDAGAYDVPYDVDNDDNMMNTGDVDNDGIGDFNVYKKFSGEFYNPRMFQIVAASLDHRLGDGGTTLTADSGYSDNPNNPGDADNVANFSKGKTMQDFSEK